MKYNSVRRLGNFPEYLATIGNPNKQYRITIADQAALPKLPYASFGQSKSLLSAPIHFRNVICTVDHAKIYQTIAQHMKRESEAINFFMINDHIFHMNNIDRPIRGWEYWVPKYASFCSAFFIHTLRHAIQFIFDDCPIPVYPLPGHTGDVLPLHLLEVESQRKREKDIPVFFHGRYWLRPARKFSCQRLKAAFPGSYMGFVDRGDFLSSEEYIDKMARSKIAWCPRSVWSEPDKNCNAPTAKEFEAMCLQTMVLRHPLGTVEPEERIPGIHFVEVKNDDSDLIEKATYYMEHDSEREEIAQNGRLWYSRNGSTVAKMNFILKKCMEAMNEPQSHSAES